MIHDLIQCTVPSQEGRHLMLKSELPGTLLRQSRTANTGNRTNQLHLPSIKPLKQVTIAAYRRPERVIFIRIAIGIVTQFLT
jgi:hypothetical protein